MPFRRPCPLPVPRRLSGLQAWYIAGRECYQDIAGTLPAIAHDDPCALIKDVSGNGRHLLQATGTKQPVIKQEALAGRPAFYFDGGDELLYTGAFTGGCLAGVCQWSGASPFPDYNGVFGNTVSDYNQMCGNAGATTLYAGVACWINGVRTNEFAPLATYKVVLVNQGAGAFGGIIMGREPWSTGIRYWTGRGVEFMVYDHDLSATERAILFAYLAGKYGITLP